MIRILHSVSNMDRAGIETMLMNYYLYMDQPGKPQHLRPFPHLIHHVDMIPKAGLPEMYLSYKARRIWTQHHPTDSLLHLPVLYLLQLLP